MKRIHLSLGLDINETYNTESSLSGFGATVYMVSSLINFSISSPKTVQLLSCLNQLQAKDDSHDLGLIYPLRAEILVAG